MCDPGHTLEGSDAPEELYEHHSFVANPGQKIIRIDKFLSVRMENTSRNKIQLAAQAGNIFANDIPVKPNYKVKPGDIISVRLAYPKREIEIIPEDIPLNIVYEDEVLLVVNKEPGMVVHPSYGHYSGTLVNGLMHRFKDYPLFDGKDVRMGLVHRIDKNTSGLLVVGKTEEAVSQLAKQFFDHTSERTYHAIVWGLPVPELGTITGHIGRSLKDRKVMDVFPDGAYGKHAVTHYRTIEKLDYVNLVECKLETGRTHQIRAHFKYIGHPLFNDAWYGGDRILRGTVFTKYKQFVQNCFKVLPRHALHAKTLGFRHPQTGEWMQFDTEMPVDMQELLDKWRNYISHRKKDG